MSVFDITDDFTANEFEPQPERMNGALVLVGQAIRDLVHIRMEVISAGGTTGHTDLSQHYFWNAFDFWCPDVAYSVALHRINLALKTLQIEDRVGFGIYPDYRYTPSFHIDLRGHKARWGRVWCRDVLGAKIWQDAEKTKPLYEYISMEATLAYMQSDLYKKEH